MSRASGCTGCRHSRRAVKQRIDFGPAGHGSASICCRATCARTSTHRRPCPTHRGISRHPFLSCIFTGDLSNTCRSSRPEAVVLYDFLAQLDSGRSPRAAAVADACVDEACFPLPRSQAAPADIPCRLLVLNTATSSQTPPPPTGHPYRYQSTNHLPSLKADGPSWAARISCDMSI